ncbi:hypothetical protein IJI94_03655 [Candidatus Saccharibacteria bacterium]|nr:hypothetical protein [Candidatus Saccharibacteria bacterium]
MAKNVDNLWNSLCKSLVKKCGTFYTSFCNCGVFNGFWWNFSRFSHVFQKFYASLFFKNTPVYSAGLAGFYTFSTEPTITTNINKEDKK